MVKRSTDPNNFGELAALLGDIVRDSGKLLGQQLDLLGAELKQELRRATGGAVSVAAGGGLTAAGGLLSGMMLAHLLHRTTRLPLWGCYGVVGGALAAGGAALLGAGGARLAHLRLPALTVAAAEENLEWLKEQVSPAAT